jgi:hypothetical protein
MDEHDPLTRSLQRRWDLNRDPRLPKFDPTPSQRCHLIG